MQARCARDSNKDVTYGLETDKKNRTRFVVGEDQLNFPVDVATPTANMMVAKLLFNSVVSSKGAKFILADVGNFYLNTPLTQPEYIQFKLTDILDKIIK